MKQDTILKAYRSYLREQSLKLTPQRRRIFDRAFATHEHFTAEQLYSWLREEEGPSVSRATVYRTLAVLVEGGFLDSLDTRRGELLYEHVLGHRHHDHMVCQDCGRIEEFYDPRIEELQLEACQRKGFELLNHTLRLEGRCRACAAKHKREAGEGGASESSEGGAGGEASSTEAESPQTGVQRGG